MSMKRFLALILFSIIVLAGPARAADLSVLTIYTYNSFISDWAPGPAVKKGLEAEGACKLNFVGVEDGVVLLSRLRLEGAAGATASVLGIDTNLTAEAAATRLFAPHQMDLSSLQLPIAWRDQTSVPYDYGYFAFQYDSTKLKN